MTKLFVYGTLRPGEVRWHLLAPFVVDDGQPDSVSGTLFDTGHGYPAATFAPDGVGAGTIVGQTYELRHATVDRCLAVLDEEEGTVGGEYRRVLIDTNGGSRAWAYEYGVGLDLTPIDSGDWLTR